MSIREINHLITFALMILSLYSLPVNSKEVSSETNSTGVIKSNKSNLFDSTINQLVQRGPEVVPSTCRKILGANSSNTEDYVSIVIMGIKVLARLSEINPSTMSISIPCMFKTVVKLKNKEINAVFLEYIGKYSDTISISFILDHLVKEADNPPAYDPTLAYSQSLTNLLIRVIASQNTPNIFKVVDTLKVEMKKHKGIRLTLAKIFLKNYQEFSGL